MEFTTSIDPVQVLTLVVGTSLPVLVGLVTTRVTHSGVKGVTLALLAALTAFASEALSAATTEIPFDVGAAGVLALGVWVTAVATHFGLWKPTGVSDKAADHLITGEVAA